MREIRQKYPQSFFLTNQENRITSSDLEKAIQKKETGELLRILLGIFEKCTRHLCRGIGTIQKKECGAQERGLSVMDVYK